jgi:hypothetical protein
MSRNLAIVAATALLALTACGGQKAPPAIAEGVPEEVVSQFLSAMDKFDPEAIRGLLSPNAKIMPPNVATSSNTTRAAWPTNWSGSGHATHPE